MPKPKTKKAPQGLSPQEVANANEKGLQTAQNSLPILQFDDMMSNFGDFTDSITDPFTQLFDTLIGRAEETTGMGPPATEAPAGQPVDPYEARLQELINNRGWTRDKAIANQASAMKQGGDFNNDGAVTNDEWAQWRTQQPAAPAPQPGAQVAQQVPQVAQQAPGMAAGQFQGVNLTPEQMASIQKFNGYGRGMA